MFCLFFSGHCGIKRRSKIWRNIEKFIPSESLPSLSSMVVEGVEGRWVLMTMPSEEGGGGMIRPCVIGVIGRVGEGIVKLLAPLLLSTLTGQWWLWLLLLASFSIESEMDKVSSSSSSDAEFRSNSIFMQIQKEYICQWFILHDLLPVQQCMPIKLATKESIDWGWNVEFKGSLISSRPICIWVLPVLGTVYYYIISLYLDAYIIDFHL